MSPRDEDDIPDWEIEDEKIPERLEDKWKKDEEKGLRAGVCRACGWVFTQDELSCAHCGARTEMGAGALVSLKQWLFKTPLGILAVLLIFISLLIYLVR
jgi:hypothetical protein